MSKAGEPALSLASGFETKDEAAWLAAVEKALKGKPFDRLVSKTEDGLAIKPLYTAADRAGLEAGLPGFAPFTRGTQPARAAEAPWTIAQTHAHPLPKAANAQILTDLENGASGVVLKLDVLGNGAPHADGGMRVSSLGDLETALEGVFLDLVPVILEAADWPLEAAVALLALYEKRGLTPGSAMAHLGLDPLTGLGLAGVTASDVEALLTDGASLAAWTAQAWPQTRTFTADGEALHARGASEAQELAGVLSAGVAYLRALETAGLAPAVGAQQIAFVLAADADLFLTIAKIRAARLLWAQVLAACGMDGANPMALRARTATRMMSKLDPWVNMLRTTAACFAAGVAGADQVTVLPHTARTGLADDFAQRIARNTQIILQEESGLGQVLDPAGGSAYLEQLTQDLATEAWSQFQALEGAGGFLAGLKSGAIQAGLTEKSRARMAAIASRKRPLTGTSEFPNLNEAPIATEATDCGALTAHFSAHRASLDALKADLPEGFEPKSWVAFAKAGYPLAPLTGLHAPEEAEAPLEAVMPTALSEPFERLRAAAALYKENEGNWPQVFLANLGPVAAFNARATFAKNFFEAGGLEAPGNDGFETPGAAAEALKASGAKLAVICSSDALYETQAGETAKALKEAGAEAVLLAGAPGPHEEAWRAAGIDNFIHIKSNLIDALVEAHERLGLGGYQIEEH